MKKVLIVTKSCDPGEMFRERGWNVSYIQDMGDVKAWKRHFDAGGEQPFDLLCFTGGADLNPKLYGEEPLGAHGWNDARDALEVASYQLFVGRLPIVGICRGGQLLNVLNGGKMIQDHGLISGVVSAWSLYEQDGEEHEVLVDHHQGILPTEEASDFIHGPDIPSGEHIAYACFYKDTRSLCFQPHPEWGHKETEDLFFDLLEEHLL